MAVNLDRYNGERLDYIHGAPDLQFLRARYYDAASGRFTSRDTYWGKINVPLSQNLYTYTMNNPVKYADPSGHYVEEKQAYLDQIASLNEQISSMQNAMYNSGLSTRSAIQNELDRLNRSLASSRNILAMIEGQMSYQQAFPKQDRMIQAANAASMRVSCDVNPSVRYIDPWKEVLTQAKSLTVGNIWAILRNTTEPFGDLANQIYSWIAPFDGPIFNYNATEFVLYQDLGLDSVGFYTGKAIGDVESMAINVLLMLSGLSGYAKGLSGFGNIGGISGSGAALSPSLAYTIEGVLVSAGTSVETVVFGYGFQNAQSDFDFAKQAWDNSWFGPDDLPNTKPTITSHIDKDPGLVKAAEEMGKDERVQKEANHLIDELMKGNDNPGLGSKNLFKDVSYLRGRNGARVFYRKTPSGYEILGKANKANEQRVINILKQLYE